MRRRHYSFDENNLVHIALIYLLFKDWGMQALGGAIVVYATMTIGHVLLDMWRLHENRQAMKAAEREFRGIVKDTLEEWRKDQDGGENADHM